MSRCVPIVINGEKLKKEFDARKLVLSEISEECGYEKSYFSKCTRENRIGKPAILFLARMYNIKFEDYAMDTAKEESKTGPVNDVNFTFTEEVSKALHDIIYSAVYEAVRRALSE